MDLIWAKRLVSFYTVIFIHIAVLLYLLTRRPISGYDLIPVFHFYPLTQNKTAYRNVPFQT
jgi:hypothetical protein